MDKTEIKCPKCGCTLYQTSTVIHHELSCPACNYYERDYKRRRVEGTTDWEGYIRILQKEEK